MAHNCRTAIEIALRMAIHFTPEPPDPIGNRLIPRHLEFYAPRTQQPNFPASTSPPPPLCSWVLAMLQAALRLPNFIWGVLILVVAVIVRDRIRYRNLPPGPRPLPFVGNRPQIPKTRPWLQMAKWAEEYGRSILSKVT
jgi:hypothetical protein